MSSRVSVCKRPFIPVCRVSYPTDKLSFLTYSVIRNYRLGGRSTAKCVSLLIWLRRAQRFSFCERTISQKRLAQCSETTPPCCQSDQTYRPICSIAGVLLSSQQNISKTTIHNVSNSKNSPSVKTHSCNPCGICEIYSRRSYQTFFNTWGSCPRVGIMAKDNLLNNLWLGSLFENHRLEFCNNSWRLVVAIIGK